MRRRTPIALLALLGLVVATLSLQPAPAQAQFGRGGPGVIVLESALSFEDTWTSLLGALDSSESMTRIAEIDHQAAAADAGLTMEGNRIAYFTDPAFTPVIGASRTAGLDLPQKMQVFEQDGSVWVAYNDTAYLNDRHGTGDIAVLGSMAEALNSLARSATGGTDTPAGQISPASLGQGLVTTTSANDFETTWSSLIDAIDASPASVAFTVDQQLDSGDTLSAGRLVVFGNAAIGTPMMQSAPNAGLDLPLKIMVYEDDAGVHVVSTAPSFVQSRHDVGDVATVGAATTAIENFTAAATTGPDGQAPPLAVAATAAAAQTDELAVTGIELDLALLAMAAVALGGVAVIGGRRMRHEDETNFSIR